MEKRIFVKNLSAVGLFFYTDHLLFSPSNKSKYKNTLNLSSKLQNNTLNLNPKIISHASALSHASLSLSLSLSLTVSQASALSLSLHHLARLSHTSLHHLSRSLISISHTSLHHLSRSLFSISHASLHLSSLKGQFSLSLSLSLLAFCVRIMEPLY